MSDRSPPSVATGMSLATLAGLSGVSAPFLSMIENGQRELRRESHVLALAATLWVAPVGLIPWVLSGSGGPAGAMPLSVLSAVRT